jgi:hypothetical protein
MAVEIPLVMTPQRNVEGRLSSQPAITSAASQAGPRILFAQSRPQMNRTPYFTINPYAQAVRRISLPGSMQASQSSPTIVRAAGVRLLPMTRYHFYGAGNIAQESSRKLVFVPQPPPTPQIVRIAPAFSQQLTAESRPLLSWTPARFIPIGRV